MIGDRIIALLKNGPMHVGQICEALDLDYTAVTPAITACNRRGLVIIVGKARDYGHAGVKATAPVYALPGTAPPAPKKPAAPHHTQLLERIRSALEGGPATPEQISALVGEPIERVRKALSKMATRYGGVVTLYALYRAPGKKKASPAKHERPAAIDPEIRVAQRITVPQYRYGSSRGG